MRIKLFFLVFVVFFPSTAIAVSPCDIHGKDSWFCEQFLQSALEQREMIKKLEKSTGKKWRAVKPTAEMKRKFGNDVTCYNVGTYMNRPIYRCS